MAFLLRISSAAGPARTVRLGKRLTTIGKSPDDDIALEDAKVKPGHAYFEQHEDGYQVIAVAGDVAVNGKRVKRAKLSLSDRITLGTTDLVLMAAESQPGTAAPVAMLGDPYSGPRTATADKSGSGPKDSSPALSQAPSANKEEADKVTLVAYRKLQAFSERLFNSYELDELLASLIDAVIEVTGADQGFLVLVEDGKPRVRVARTLRKQALADPDQHLSDSIVEKVLRTAQPVFVSDALRDAEFQNAESVLHLRLSSVMCVPLRERGALLGAIYVGSSRLANLFRRGDLEVFTVLAAQASLILRNAMLVSALQRDNQRLGEQLENARSGTLLSLGEGSSPSLQSVLKTIAKVASTDVSVLITGETGTGKELVAREIHARSSRSRGPLVAINCGAIPEQLLESELFGHVRGAFTGAVASKAGRFQAAAGGTIFLDEIGEMPVALQVKLLRVLQERAVMRVGDTKAEPVDVRILAATHRDLPAEIRAGRFREDLYYRLNVVQIHVPPLRERHGDAVLLAKYFLRRFADELKVPPRMLSAAAESAIAKHPWPGNVRQLENHVKKALVLGDGLVLEPADLGVAPVAPTRTLPLSVAKERFAREYVLEILAQNGGNRTKTARDLDVDPRTVFRFLEKEGQSGEEAKVDPDADGNDA